MTMIECPECCGEKEVIYSCCGDNITYSDYMICPTCREHCGDEKEPCGFCDGLGEVDEPEMPDFSKMLYNIMR